VSRLGIEAIIGKPYKPTTQGGNGRFHQTLFRYLDKQPLADTLTQSQTRVDAFDRIYNIQRPHQGLPGPCDTRSRVGCDHQGRSATPRLDRPRFEPPVAPACRRPRVQPPTDLPEGTTMKRLSPAGTFRLDSVTYLVAGRYGLNHVLVVTDGNPVTITNLDGEILAHHTRPAPWVSYVGNGRGPGPSQARRSITEVLRHELSPMS
jgi:putative transposase